MGVSTKEKVTKYDVLIWVVLRAFCYALLLNLDSYELRHCIRNSHIHTK